MRSEGGHQMHIRAVSLDDDNLSRLATTNAAVESMAGGRESRRSGDALAIREQNREDAFRRLSARPESAVGNRPVSSFGARSRDGESGSARVTAAAAGGGGAGLARYDTPPLSAHSSQSGSGPGLPRESFGTVGRRLLTPREQRELDEARAEAEANVSMFAQADGSADFGGELRPSDSQQTVLPHDFEFGRVSDSDSRHQDLGAWLVGRGGGGSAANKHRSLPPMPLPQPLPVLPSERAGTPDLRRRDSERDRRNLSVTSIATVRAAPAVQNAAAASAAVTPHTVSTSGIGTAGGSNDPAGVSSLSLAVPLSRTNSARSGENRQGVMLSRASVGASASTLAELRQPDEDGRLRSGGDESSVESASGRGEIKSAGRTGGGVGSGSGGGVPSSTSSASMWATPTATVSTTTRSSSSSVAAAVRQRLAAGSGASPVTPISGSDNERERDREQDRYRRASTTSGGAGSNPPSAFNHFAAPATPSSGLATATARRRGSLNGQDRLQSRPQDDTVSFPSPVGNPRANPAGLDSPHTPSPSPAAAAAARENPLVTTSIRRRTLTASAHAVSPTSPSFVGLSGHNASSNAASNAALITGFTNRPGSRAGFTGRIGIPAATTTAAGQAARATPTTATARTVGGVVSRSAMRSSLDGLSASSSASSSASPVSPVNEFGVRRLPMSAMSRHSSLSGSGNGRASPALRAESPVGGSRTISAGAGVGGFFAAMRHRTTMGTVHPADRSAAEMFLPHLATINATAAQRRESRRTVTDIWPNEG